MLYAVSIVVRVLVAVLAIGLVGAIPLTARFARQSEGQLAGTEPFTTWREYVEDSRLDVPRSVRESRT